MRMAMAMRRRGAWCLVLCSPRIIMGLKWFKVGLVLDLVSGSATVHARCAYYSGHLPYAESRGAGSSVIIDGYRQRWMGELLDGWRRMGDSPGQYLAEQT